MVTTRGNILYKDLYDEIIDRLDNFATTLGAGGEYLRQKKASDVVIAQAATYGMIELLRAKPFQAVPDLIETVELESAGRSKGAYIFPFPHQALKEREDGGIVSFVVNGEEMPWEASQPYDVVVSGTDSLLYSGSDNKFSVSLEKQRIYTSCKDVKAVILKRPHSIFAPSQNMFAGASITIDTVNAVAGDVTIFDGFNGAGNSVTASILAGDSENERYLKIRNAINSGEDILYSALYEEGDPFIQLTHKYSLESDRPLKPLVGPDGTGDFTIADTGTYEIPLPYHYIHEVSLLSFRNLTGTNPPQQPEPAQREDDDE